MAVDVARFEGDQTVALIFKVYTNGERYKIITDDMYSKKTSGYIEK